VTVCLGSPAVQLPDLVVEAPATARLVFGTDTTERNAGIVLHRRPLGVHRRQGWGAAPVQLPGQAVAAGRAAHPLGRHVAQGLRAVPGGAVDELRRRQRGPPRPQPGPRRTKQRRRPAVAAGLTLADGGCAARDSNPNRCLKRARRPLSRPAAQRRKGPSTRSFPYRDCPLLTHAGRCSVPPMCPSGLSGAVSRIPDSLSNISSITCHGGDLARPRPGPADRGTAGAVRGPARRRPGHRPGGGRQDRALRPRRRHQGLEPDAA
jgi:hypothetical protein